MIYTPSLLPDKALAEPVERWFEGELTRLDGIGDRIDRNRIPVRSLFRDLSIELKPAAFVVADSVIPVFHWWYLAIFALCLLGLSYIGHRLLRTILFIGDRDALYRHLAGGLARPRNRSSGDDGHPADETFEDIERR